MPRSLRFVATWILAAGLLALHAALFDHVADDAYISFRYVRNALAGHGLVFNPGERVEGYTNFLWILMLAPGAARGVALPRLAAGLGVVCMGAAVALRWRLAGEEAAPAAEAATATWTVPAAGALLLCASGPVAYWAAGGLETGVFCLLILLLLNFVWRAGRVHEALGAGVAGALLCMARPDGLLYVIAGAGWLLCAGRPDVARRDRRRLCAILVVTFAAVYAPYFVWRWQYYDAVLPNTFYAKVGGGGASIVRGSQYVLAWLLVSGAGAYALLAGGIILWRRGAGSPGPDPTRRALAWLIGAFAAAALVFVLAVGGDQLAMFRFMVPLMVLAAPTLWKLAAERVPSPAARVMLAVTLVIVLLVPSFVGPMARRVFGSERPVDRDRAAIGRWLRETQPAETLIAVVPAGILPYYARLPTLDLVGLNDRHIARADVGDMGRGTPGHERYDADYVVARAPDLVFLGACRLRDEPLTPEELTSYVQWYAQFVPGVGVLLAHPTFQAEYAPRALPIANRYAHVWVRRDGGRVGRE